MATISFDWFQVVAVALFLQRVEGRNPNGRGLITQHITETGTRPALICNRTVLCTG